MATLPKGVLPIEKPLFASSWLLFHRFSQILLDWRSRMPSGLSKLDTAPKETIARSHLAISFISRIFMDYRSQMLSGLSKRAGSIQAAWYFIDFQRFSYMSLASRLPERNPCSIAAGCYFIDFIDFRGYQESDA